MLDLLKRRKEMLTFLQLKDGGRILKVERKCLPLSKYMQTCSGAMVVCKRAACMMTALSIAQ